MEIKIFKTQQINDEQWVQIVAGFNESFEGHHTTKAALKRIYESTEFGFSYHSLCFDGDKIIGFNTITPYKYYHNNEIITLGLSGTTFVLKKYRKDIFIFHDMFIELKKYCHEEGVIAILGVPNKNSYQYSLKLLKFKEVFSLPYYILPIKISKIILKKEVKLLDAISKVISMMWLIISFIMSLFLPFKQKLVTYRLKVDDEFLDKRLPNIIYNNRKKKNKRYSYRIFDEDGIKTAYIMDFRENGKKSFRTLIWIVWDIFRKENIDVLLFVGTMNIKQTILFKVPSKLHPRKLPFTYNLLDISDKEKYKDMSTANNWDFSLINFDTR